MEVKAPYLAFPQFNLSTELYTRLKMKLDFYEDYIMATHYDEAGQPGAAFMVDPMALAGALGGLSFDSGLLPKNCLFWQRRDNAVRLAIYVPPQVWSVAVTVDKIAWCVPLPGFVFVGHSTQYSIRAVKAAPDGPMTKLYQFPAPNISGNGTICAGNVNFPSAAGETIREAADIFFMSKFNTHLANGKSEEYKHNVLDRWKELDAVEADEYPLNDLVPANCTLANLMEGK